MAESDVLQKISMVAEHYITVAGKQSSDMARANVLLSGMTAIVGVCAGAMAMAMANSKARTVIIHGTAHGNIEVPGVGHGK